MMRHHQATVKQWHKDHPREHQTTHGLVTTDTGTLNELRVACDLLAHGFEVHKNLTTRGSDLTAWHNSHAVRIEVKTGSRQKDGGKLYTCFKSITNTDLVAVVYKEHIRYVTLNPRAETTLEELKHTARLFN